MLTALAIFVVTYAIIAVQKIPGVHISRAAGALVGAVAMGVFGVLTLEEVYAAIDLDTIVFLLGMMILVSVLEISGFFETLEWWILKRARTGSGLLALIVFSSGFLSALFMNDTICLMFAPVVLRLTHRIGAPPIPFLIALVTSANIGSVMTLIGNPQNMLIGIRSQIPFMEFTGALWQVSVIGLVIDFALLRWFYRKELAFALDSSRELPEKGVRQSALMRVSLLVMLAFLILLVLGYPPQSTASSLAALLILVSSQRTRRPLQYVDWPLLLLFAGLFIVMRGVEKVGILDQVLQAMGGVSAGGWHETLLFSGVTLLAANLVSNVPAVLLLSPWVGTSADPHAMWLLLGMVATLAGNLTILGSAANVIVLEVARQGGVTIGFLEYFKIGLPLTLLTLSVGIASLIFR